MVYGMYGVCNTLSQSLVPRLSCFVIEHATIALHCSVPYFEAHRIIILYIKGESTEEEEGWRQAQG